MFKQKRLRELGCVLRPGGGGGEGARWMYKGYRETVIKNQWNGNITEQKRLHTTIKSRIALICLAINCLIL